MDVLMTRAGVLREGRKVMPVVLVLALLVWAAGWFVAMRSGGGLSWHFFVHGQTILFSSPHGLDLYADQPVLQIGPVAFAVAWLLGPLGPAHGMLPAEVLCTALGVAVLGMVRQLARRSPAATRLALTGAQLDRRLLLAAFAFVPVWSYVAVASLHLDDALALTFGVAAVLAARRGHPALAGLAVALAVDAKPWAVPFVAVVLLLPGRRGRVVGAGVAGLGVLVAWAPFFLADPETVRALHFTIVNSAMSTLRVLGVSDPRTPPWDRPAQSLLGLVLAVWAIRRGRWPAALLVVLAVRVGLDPGTNRYYMAGLAVGAVLWDVCGSRLRWPVWTAAVLVLHELRLVSEFNPAHGWLVLAFALCVLGFLVLAPPAGEGAVGRQMWRRAQSRG